MNSTYQLGEVCVHKLDLNSTFWIPVFTTHISPKSHPNIIQISPKYQLGKNSSFNPDIARLLPVKTPLWNSIKTPLLEGKSRVLLDFNSSFCLLGLFFAMIKTVWIICRNMCENCFYNYYPVGNATNGFHHPNGGENGNSGSCNQNGEYKF